jgi:hypothetical protein
MSLGLLIGVVAGLLAFWFPAYSPAFFTPDERLHGLMQALAPQVPSSHLLLTTRCPLVLTISRHYDICDHKYINA